MPGFTHLPFQKPGIVPLWKFKKLIKINEREKDCFQILNEQNEPFMNRSNRKLTEISDAFQKYRHISLIVLVEISRHQAQTIIL